MNYYNNKQLHQIKAHLKQGGVIAYPTESCYGFGCDPLNHKAINKILKLKRRDKNKGLIVVASEKRQLNKLISSLPESTQLEKYWPGFYTLLLPTTDFVPYNLIGKHSKLAVRVSNHPLVRQLCSYMNMAIVSTSANQSKCLPSKNYRECKRLFGSSALVLPGLTQFAKTPSTIIDWQTKNILRGAK